MGFQEKKIDGKLYTAMKTYPKKSEAKKVARQLKKQEYHGYTQLARVIKTSLGWTVYVTVGRNVRYGIARKAYAPEACSVLNDPEVKASIKRAERNRGKNYFLDTMKDLERSRR